MVRLVQLYVVIALLSLLSVVGVSGNALVLFVFSSKRDGLVSTLFIMVLAFIDLTTCAVIVPFTIVMELRDYHVSSDFVCKLYQFLITSNVPFSSLVMAAIAVDRYLCICRPFWRVLTVTRAKWIVALLALLVSCLGLIGSLTHGVYRYKNVTSTTPFPEATYTFNSGQLRADENITTVKNNIVDWIWVNIEQCEPNEVHISKSLGYAYQKCYNGVFFSCLLVVSVLYSLIYKSVRQRQLWREQQKSKTPSTAASQRQQSHCQQQQPKTTQCHLKQPAVVTPATRLSLADGQSVRLLATDVVMWQADNEHSRLPDQKTLHSSAKRCCTAPHLAIQEIKASNITSVTSETSAAAAATTATTGSLDRCCDNSTEPDEKIIDEMQQQAKMMSYAVRSLNDTSFGTDEVVTVELSLVEESYTPCLLKTSNAMCEDGVLRDATAANDVTRAVDDSTVAVTTGVHAKNNGGTLTSQKNRIANIRMAAMLFVVTLVFVTTFMPALAMTMELIPHNIIIFYMYFSYSVANPIIYSFMNQNFRKQLSRIFGKRQH